MITERQQILEYYSSVRINSANSKDSFIAKTFGNETLNSILQCSGESLVEKIYRFGYNIKSDSKCKICENNTKFIKFSVGYATYCSNECRILDSATLNERSKKTKLEKYGDENYTNRKAIEKTNLERYGCTVASKSESVKTTIKETNKQRYGVEWFTQSVDFKEKSNESLLRKYGTVTPWKNDKQFSKTLRDSKRKNKELKFVTFEDKDRDFDKNFNEIRWKCKKCGEIFTLGEEFIGHQFDNRVRHSKCYPKGRSFGEIEIGDFLDSIGVRYKTHVRNRIKPFELDLYLEDFDLGIEFNGWLWHSYGKSNHKYLNNIEKEDKTNLSKKNDLIEMNGSGNILHILDLDWRDPIKKEIWKSIIRSKLRKNKKIYARNLQKKEIFDKKIVYDFFDKNHLSGSCHYDRAFGLFEDENLLMCICIGKPRFDRSADLEIIRSATQMGITVVGGFSKILSYIAELEKGKTIISYADRLFSNGNSYKKNGFELVSVVSPGYFYVKNGKRVKRFQSQKSKLEKLLGENFDETKTEVINMIDAGYRRVWDAGNLKFIKTL